MISLQDYPTKIQHLSNYGFTKIGKISELFEIGLPNLFELNSCGVYSITVPNCYTPNFHNEKESLQNGNVISPWSLFNLRNKWVDGVEIVYFGLAGSKSHRSLRKRLSDLIRHGKGLTTERGPHKGGEILWQLKGYEEFSIWVKPTGNPPRPRETELELLNQFFAATGKLPFANKQF